MMMKMRINALILLSALLLLSSASCFDVVTGGNVDKEWPRNNARNPRHSTLSASDSIRIIDTIK